MTTSTIDQTMISTKAAGTITVQIQSNNAGTMSNARVVKRLNTLTPNEKKCFAVAMFIFPFSFIASQVGATYAISGYSQNNPENIRKGLIILSIALPFLVVSYGIIVYLHNQSTNRA